MRGTRLYLLLLSLVLILFLFVMLRSCHSGNDPQSLDDDPERTTVSTLALTPVTVA